MASISSNLKDLQARANEALKEASVKGKRKDSLLQSLEQLRKAHFDIIDVVEKYKLAYPGLAQKFTQTTARADSLEKSIKAKFSSSYFATRTASEVQDNESTLLTNWNSDKAVESVFKAEFDLANANVEFDGMKNRSKEVEKDFEALKATSKTWDDRLNAWNKWLDESEKLAADPKSTNDDFNWLKAYVPVQIILVRSHQKTHSRIIPNCGGHPLDSALRRVIRYQPPTSDELEKDLRDLWSILEAAKTSWANKKDLYEQAQATADERRTTLDQQEKSLVSDIVDKVWTSAKAGKHAAGSSDASTGAGTTAGSVTAPPSNS